METKIEAKASEQGADEALKSLYASLGSGVKILLDVHGHRAHPLGGVQSEINGHENLSCQLGVSYAQLRIASAGVFSYSSSTTYT